MFDKKILVVDDELEISQLIEKYLTRERFHVITANNGTQALELATLKQPDLIILDILLPDLDGIQVCQKLRTVTDAPIFFLSCKDEDTDKVLGLSIGGDDYITKPFSPSELVARVKAHLRRYCLLDADSKKNNILKFPGLEMDENSYSVTVNGNPVTLPAKEFQLLCIFTKNPNQVFTTEHLFNLVWKEENLGDARTVVVHISNLRKKIEPDPSNPKFIHTIRGVGYKFNPTI